MIDGYVAKGYEPVYEIFKRHVKDGIEDGSQLCIYVKGELVIDLWTTSALNKPYGPDHIQNVFSTTKVITSLVIAMLVDRGYLKYNQKIIDIWPEYGQNGKENTTLEMIMRHEGGLAKFDQKLDTSDLTTESICNNSICNIIADQIPSHEPGTERHYHAFTRGIIINEIVRRVDPQGRTIGQFIRDEITKPLNIDKQLCVGLKNDEFDKSIDVILTDPWWTWIQLLLPRFLGGGKVAVCSKMIRLATLIGIPYIKTRNWFYKLFWGIDNEELDF